MVGGSVVFITVWLGLAATLLCFGRVSMMERVHDAYSHGLLVLSPAPFGWKLEPHLYGAIRTGVGFYTALFRRFVWHPFLSFGLVPAVLSAGMTWSLLARSFRGVLVACCVLFGCAGGLLVALLALVTQRVCQRLAQLLWSLALLFAGRFRSTLKKRSEPAVNVSLDSVLLGLLLFTAVLLLFPVLLLNAVVFSALDLPRRIVLQIMFEINIL